MLNSGQNCWFFSQCDLEIWLITLNNIRAPLQCHFKLCASFCSHLCIQTGVTVWKWPNRDKIVLTSVALTSDRWQRPFAWTSFFSMAITAENFTMIQWENIVRQDRRWNADKPWATLDPYIPTWLTTSPANHRPANFWKSFFKHWKKIVKSGAISDWTDEDQFQIWSSHSLILQVQIITYIIYQSTNCSTMGMLTYFHSMSLKTS